MTDDTPVPELVEHPWAVMLTLREPTLGTYRFLSMALDASARAANDAAAVAASAGNRHAATEMRAVRDALRSASTAALLGRRGKPAAPCRRCGADCATCSPQVTA